MHNTPSLRRGLLIGLTVAIFAGVLAIVGTQSPGTTNAANDPSSAQQVIAPPGIWPLFGGGTSRNMINLTDKGIPGDFTIEEDSEFLKWKADLGSKSYGGPTVASGKIFVGTNNDRPRNPRDREKPDEGEELGKPLDKGVIMCFEEKTGKFLWQAIHDKLPSGQVQDWPHEGICSAPLVEGDRIWYCSNQCRVVCADTEGFANGNQGIQTEKYQDKTDVDIIWELDMLKDLGVFPHNLTVCSPLLIGDILFIVTANGVDAEHINIPSPEAPSFIAVDKHTGKVLWKDNSPGRNIMHGQWSNPTYAVIKGVPQVIFPGGDGWLYAFKPDSGKLLWKFDANPKDSKYELGGRGTKSDFIATPVIYEDKVYIGTGQDPEHLDGIGHLWCIDPSKATETNVDLSPKNDNFDPKAPENKDSGLVWHFGGKENRETSKREFVFGRTMSTCAIVDGILYVAELNGFFFCLDAKTGKKFYHYDLKSGVWGSPYYVDGKVYIGNEAGDLFVFKHDKNPEVMDEDDAKDAKELKLIRAKIKERYDVKMIAIDEPLRSTPVVANGVLYLLSERSLFAIAKK